MGRSSCYIAPERYFHPTNSSNNNNNNASLLSTSATTSSASLDSSMIFSSSFYSPNTNTNRSFDSNNNKTSDTRSSSSSSMPNTSSSLRSLTSAIDIFSLGCTIAEICLDGTTFIDLPSMLVYLQLQQSQIQLQQKSSSYIHAPSNISNNTTNNTNSNTTTNNKISSKKSSHYLETLTDENAPIGPKNLLKKISNPMIRQVCQCGLAMIR